MTSVLNTFSQYFPVSEGFNGGKNPIDVHRLLLPGSEVLKAHQDVPHWFLICSIFMPTAKTVTSIQHRVDLI